jgi:outer membrane receptor protein involved in Fe transport
VPLHAAGLVASLALAAAPSAPAQAVPASPSAATATTARPADGTAPLELSPFEVRADDDVGYQAANTTSGSRLNSRLKDTPAAVSAFTPEFLSDIAATNLEEMLGHATNIEIDVEDANAGFNNPQGRDATGNDYTFRMRGSPAGASRDFVESSIPVDLYNVERAEVASGPNSILFGLGSAGGLVSLTGKKAHLTRERTTLKAILGSWNYERYEGDHNQVLIPRKLSLRLNGLYQNSQGWRYWDFTDQARLSAAVAYQPFKHTTVHASYEKGHMDNNLTMGWNASDQVTAWLAAGRPTADGAAVTGTNRLSTTNNRFTFSEQDGVVYNLRGELQSSSRFAVATLLPPEMSPYNYNVTGPGGVRHQTFDSYQLQVQQKLPRNVVLELAYFHNETDIEANGNNVSGGGIDLRGDPNANLPAPDGSSAILRNPRAGQLFLETSWFKDRLIVANDVARLSAAWDVGKSDRWFGRHRVAALLENSEQDRLKRWRNEILVDQNNVPITNATNAEGAQNQLTRRHYVTEGDFANYYGGDPSIPVPTFTWNGRQISATYAARGRGNTHTLKDINTLMFASQSFWLKDRLVTTLGIRRDDIKFQNAQEARILDANDPRVTSKQFTQGEWDFDGTYVTHRFKPTTFTAGAVVHATKRISLFYNLSKNTGTPRFDRTVLPTGDIPEPTEGEGQDYGFMFDLLGDERFFVRTTFFETSQLKDTPILPGANALGVDNLATMLGALLSAGKITQADYDRQAVNYTTATIDVFTEGLEVEFVANPTKNLSLRASYSHSERRRQNFFQEIFAFYGERLPQWRALLANNPTELATFDTAAQELASELAFQVDRQNSPFGTRPHKMNGTARYKFTEGRLRGAFLGGSIRYNGKNFMSQNLATGQVYWGNETLLGDVFGGYRFRVPRTKINATVQLNVKNVSNSYLANVGRYNDDYTGVRRVYLNEPRSYRFTTTLEF